MNRILIVVAMLLPATLMANSYQKYKNLGNPTEYVYDYPLSIIEKTWKDTVPARIGDIVASETPNGLKGIVFSGDYCDRYWSGPRERPEDVHPSEAGQIGTITAVFSVSFQEIGKKTKVSVVPLQLDQRVGRHYSIFPHFRKTGVYVKIKSDTYFEYLFLSKFGVILGQKGMPPLNDGTGRPVDVNAIPVIKLDQ